MLNFVYFLIFFIPLHHVFSSVLFLFWKEKTLRKRTERKHKEGERERERERERVRSFITGEWQTGWGNSLPPHFAD